MLPPYPLRFPSKLKKQKVLEVSATKVLTSVNINHRTSRAMLIDRKSTDSSLCTCVCS